MAAITSDLESLSSSLPATGAPAAGASTREREPSSRRARALVIGVWLLTLALFIAWMRNTPTAVLREQLKAAQFWSLEICILLAAALGVTILREIGRALDRRDVLRMTILAAVALAAAVFVAPRTNRIYYDEQIYQGIGQNLADLKRAQMCNDGTVEYRRLVCSSGEYNKQPYAYPHLLSLLYRGFGVRETTAFVVNALAMAATSCIVYLLVLTLFGNDASVSREAGTSDSRVAAWFAGLLLVLTPQQIIWSATAAVEPSASLACAFAVLAAAWFARSQSMVALAGAGVTAAYALQFRPESFLILPAIGIVLWPRRDAVVFKRTTAWWVALLCLGLMAVHIAHLFAVRNEGWGAGGSEARWSLDYLMTNLRVNGWFYLADERFPAAFTWLAVLGLTSRRSPAARLAIAVYFLAFFCVYLLFYAGSYNYGADVRYSLMTYPPLAVLGGLGAARVARWLAKVGPGLHTRWVLSAGIAFQFLSFAPLVRATTEEAWAARADVKFARSLVPELHGNSYVLTHNPAMFHVWGVNAGQMSQLLTTPQYLEYLASRYAAGVYLHWNFWCNVQDPVQRRFCTSVIERQPADLVREYRERDQRFALYRLQVLP